MWEVALVAVLLCSSLATWVILWARKRAGSPWVAYESRDPAPWGLLDVFLALLLLVVLTSITVGVLRARGQDAAPRGLDKDLVEVPEASGLTPSDVFGQAIASVATLVISVTAIRVRYFASSAALGWSRTRLLSDVRLGAVAFLALAPPVYALQLILVQWYESQHPLVEMLQQHPGPRSIIVCWLSAVVVAPIVEEYLFRGLLQGWLERFASDPKDLWGNLLGGPTMVGPGLPADFPPAADPAGAPPAGAAYWPIFVSAIAFALMHYSHGPDWIPLFVLAVGLGYLYRQTHRLAPVVTVHLLLNACSMTVLLVS